MKRLEIKLGGSRERQQETSYKLKMFELTTETGLTRRPYQELELILSRINHNKKELRYF